MNRTLRMAMAVGALLVPALAAGPGTGGLWAQSAGQAGEALTVELTLYAPGSRAVRYRGLRTVRHEAGQVTVATTFTTPAGEPIQRTVAVYERDTLAPVSWQLRDLRSGERETLERGNGTLHMSYRAGGEEAPDEDSVEAAEGQVFTATVVPYLRRRWSDLAAGETVNFGLLVPSRQDVFRFRALRDDAAPGGGPGRVVVRMEPGTWLIRQLVDPLYFVLDADPPHRLREFRGRSSIRDDAGEEQDLRMVYTYPDA